MNKNQLLYNAIVTPDGTKLVSHYTHDYVVHKDAKTGQIYGTDGGLEYQKLTGDVLKDCKNLAQYDDGGHSKRRVFLEWGVSTDKDGNRLPAIRWTPICELDTDHIQAILKGNHTANPLYVETFKDELELRGIKIVEKSDLKKVVIKRAIRIKEKLEPKPADVNLIVKKRLNSNYVTIFTICTFVMISSTLISGLFYVTKSHLNIIGYPIIYAGIHWAIKKFIK